MLDHSSPCQGSMNSLPSLSPSWQPLLLSAILFACPLLQWAQCQSCGPRVSPRLLREIPCDMSSHSYCTQPGSAYPWSAVRRYIYDNQGFMKRMYGEHRQSQIIQEEMARMSDLYETPSADFRSAKSGPMIPQMEKQSDAKLRPDAPKSGIDLNDTRLLEKNFDEEHEKQSVLVNESIVEKKTDPENLLTGGEDPELNVYLTTTAARLANDFEEKPSLASDFESAEERDGATTEATDVDTNSAAADEESTEKEPKGYNACPITQEVVAPYWANNTRGQTLALLNVYPFEQYIHWEKCAFEGEQMNCREGCRCEQQYRLHRLLAFDPKNECRGIFADWFRFPGCCVCICYDNHERINNRKARL